MSDEWGVEVRALASLLRSDEDEDDEDEDNTHSAVAELTPGDLAVSTTSVISSGSKRTRSSSQVTRSSSQVTRSSSQVTRSSSQVTRSSAEVNIDHPDLLGDIWEVEEVRPGHCWEESDPRPPPEYQVTFRHLVSASHVFLPVSVAGVEDVVVRVVLPGTLLTEVTLEVTSTTLRLASPAHYLHIPLPRPVLQRQGVASWDPSTHTLTVTLPTAHSPHLTPTIIN
ncbi:uncharacterized protein Dnaaf6 [Procambarus clarkii]|uniref:uncharacterized protein Dnaaf6 n=1 Tax=Procambarus clarkii TaxID=6728 RepID=UPI003744526A